MRAVPAHIIRPDYVTGGRITTASGTQMQDPASLARLRHASAVAAEVLLRAGDALDVGRTTDEIDAIAHDEYVEFGAYPSTLGYKGFSKSICTSVNGVICHGIPDNRPLEDGDVVNLDVTAFVGGMHGDTSATFIVGSASSAIEGLVESTRQATLLGIEAIRPYEPLRRIGAAIETFAVNRGYGVVREYGGHGIGVTFHGAPHINHTVTRDDDVLALPGMTFTVEPMLTTGRPRFSTAPDGWTERLDDDMPSAQFEHTIVVTHDGAEILTRTADGRSAVDVPASAGRNPSGT